MLSRDTILHIDEKEELFRKFLHTLKPGGKLMISDYCHGDQVTVAVEDRLVRCLVSQAHSQEFEDYVAERGYKLQTVRGYGDILKAAGFKNVGNKRKIAVLSSEFFFCVQGDRRTLMLSNS